MTEKTDRKYLKEAAENMKKIYKKLGHSPRAAEYDKIAEPKFKLSALYKKNIKLNQLKEAAGVPKRKSGFKAGEHKSRKSGSERVNMFCQACKSTISSKECVPKYKPKKCAGCPNIQIKNAMKISDLPEEIETSDRYNNLSGGKYLNGNSIYMTDVGVI